MLSVARLRAGPIRVPTSRDALSRPSHLLCFAVHKQRFAARLTAVAGPTWDIVDLG